MNYKTIFKAGLIVGTLDIIAALIQYMIQTGKNPLMVLKFIASGVVGNLAFAGGSEMVVLGLIFHFIIAILFAAFFFLLVSRVSFLSENKILTGVFYGIFIWLVMTFLVLPLSKAPKMPFDPGKAIVAVLILIVCIGLPFAFLMPQSYNRRQTEVVDGINPGS